MKSIIMFLLLVLLGVTASAQISFVVSSSPAVASGPQGMTAADLNGDGKVDLISANATASSLTILTNNGSGGFTLLKSPGVGSLPATVCAADLNGDGIPDLAAANYGNGTVTVLLNDGNGNTLSVANYASGSHPEQIRAVDLNGDGKLDLAIANSSDNNIRLLINDGKGGFISGGIVAVGAAPWGLVAADVNGDHHADLIVANQTDKTVMVFTNDGIGSMTLASTISVGTQPIGLQAADLNNDGYTDLICANNGDNTISVMLNDGMGNFSTINAYSVGSNPIDIAAADLDGDGFVDLAVADDQGNAVTVLQNDGAGNFSNVYPFNVGARPEGIVAVDVNGDGLLDLVTSDRSGAVLTVLTNATTSIGPVSAPVILTQPVSITNFLGTTNFFNVTAIALTGPQLFGYQWQFNGANIPAATNNVLPLRNVSANQNGLYTVVVSNSVGSITSAPAMLSVTLYVDQLTFLLTSSPGVGSSPQGIATADVNGDGLPDLISANAGGSTLTVLTNNGGGFVLAYSPSVGSSPSTVAAADFNGDGRVDLVSANYGSGNVALLTNSYNGGFGFAGNFSVGANPEQIVALDVNGDGWMDVAVANNGGNSISVLVNNGSGGFTAATSYPVAGNPFGLVAADVNGDGKIDLISANNGNSTITVLTNNGFGGFVFAGSNSVPGGPQAVTALDVNHDGYMDLVAAITGGGTLVVLTNDNTGRFVAAATNTVGAGPFFMAAADLNSDGKLDLACANNGSASITVLTNNSGGGFGFATTLLTGSIPEGVAILDVDHDGHLDVVSGSRSSSTISVYRNSTILPPFSAPSIIVQPKGLTNLIGSYLQMSVQAAAPTGPQLFNYQWRLSGTNLPAATNNILNLTNVFPTQSGNYDVVVSNPVGSLTSSPAILLVNVIQVAVNGQVQSTAYNAVGSATISAVGGYPGGFIFYTLDGSTPTVNSSFYTGSFVVSNSAVIQMMALSADFTQTAYSPAIVVQIVGPLNASSPGGGSILANGYPISSATNYSAGTPVTLTATASNGWTFIGWQGMTNTTSNPLSITYSQPNNLQAIFGTTVATNTAGNGTIVLSKSNPVPFGTLLKASGVPAPGSYLLAWSGAASGTNTPTTVVVTNPNSSVNGLFTALPAGKFSLSVVILGSGTVTNNPQRSYYNSGDSVMLSASNFTGAAFLGWSGDVVSVSTNITVVMTNSKVIVATFGLVPSVIVTPTNQTVFAGSNAVITAIGSGAAPMAYQWQNGFGPINGATDPVFTLSNTVPASAGNYFVIVSNSYGSATSTVSTLTIVGAPVITNQPPVQVTVTNGHSASFTVGAYGWPNLNYQWRLNGLKLIGATGAGYTVTNAFSASAGTYSVVITNIYGSVTSSPSQLMVLGSGITSPAQMADGSFRLTFDTASGVHYTVLYSVDLLSWTPLVTLDGIGSPVTVTDPNPTGGLRRYYRIKLVYP